MAKVIDNPDVETPTSNTVAQPMQPAQNIGGANYKPISQNMINKMQENNQGTQPQTVQPQATEPVQQQQVQQAQQPVQTNTQAVIPVRTPSDLYDGTTESYLNDYKKGMEINDYQAQINALSALDSYRQSRGLEPIYTSNIYELTNLRQQKMDNAIRDYETQMSTAINNGDYATAQNIGTQLTNYKRDVNYQDNVDNAATYLRGVEYKSQYDDIINNIVNELYTMRFTYNPNEDQALRLAQDYATNTVMEKMNARGLLNSTMTAQIITETVNNLQVQYQQMAKEDFYENVERLKSMASFIINLDELQYSRWADNVNNNLQYYEALRDEQDYQWERVNQLGYVDNTASVILGVAPGTLSPALRQAIMDMQASTQKAYDNLYTDMALYEAKAKIDAQYKNSGSGTSTPVIQEDVVTEPQETGTVNKNTKFYGTLTDTELKSQMKAMYNGGESAASLIKFAKANAKNFNEYVGALTNTWKSTNAAGIEETEGWEYTIDEANAILKRANEKPTIDEVNARIDRLWENDEPTRSDNPLNINLDPIREEAVKSIMKRYPNASTDTILNIVNTANMTELNKIALGGKVKELE